MQINLRYKPDFNVDVIRYMDTSIARDYNNSGIWWVITTAMLTDIVASQFTKENILEEYVFWPKNVIVFLGGRI